jgi:hypothetical protein
MPVGTQAPTESFQMSHCPRGIIAFEIALRTPREALRISAASVCSVVESLIDVELKGLRRVGIINIKIQIVNEIADTVSACYWIEYK